MHGAQQMGQPLANLHSTPIVLDPARLPEYALRTTLRMFAAIIASLLFTFVVATAAAKRRKAELVIIPMLDILQSVPVYGYLTFTVTFFIGLFPTSELGVECASIFAVFTTACQHATSTHCPAPVASRWNSASIVVAAAVVAPIMSAWRPGARSGFSLTESLISVGVL